MRDLRILQLEEKKALEKINKKYLLDSLNNKKSVDEKELYQQYPFIKNYLSLFPNQYINPILINKNGNEFCNSINEFETIVNNKKVKERDILKFIKNNPFIVASIVKKYADWGHHDLYVFPEFKLGTSYVVDYLIVGKNSYGYHFMFVELESVYGNVIRKNGDFGYVFNKGMDQLTDWKVWLDNNYNCLRNEFEKYRGEKDLPKEFFYYDRTRVSFAIVAGRRTDFKDKTYWLRGDLKGKIIILHYDNLIDLSRKVLNERSF